MGMVPQYKFDKPSNKIELVKRLIRFGYHPVPIPPGCKGPSLTGWQNLRMTEDQAEEYFKDPESLIGILHINNVVFDVDVYDPDIARLIVEEGVRRFPGALERVGQEPKSALVLRMEQPNFRIHNTEKHEVTTEDGEILSAQVEVRSVTRQFVAYGKHPDTGRLYRWTRGELWENPLSTLPAVTQEEAQSFRDWCNNRIRRWAGVSDGNIIDLGLYPRQSVADERPTEKHFLRLIEYVPPSLGHESGWREMLMAIHDYYGGSLRGLEVAKDWSSGDPRYTPQEVETKWRSFEAGKGVTYKSVFYHARAHGADLSDLTRQFAPKSPERPAPNFNFDPDRSSSANANSDGNLRSSADPNTWQIQRTDAFTADFVSPEYIIDGVIRRGMLYTLTAPTGSGKTAVMLYASTAIATGGSFGNRECEHGDVLFMAGENPDDVRARVIATLEFYGIDPKKCRLHFIAGTFSIRNDLDRLRREVENMPNLMLVVIDTFAAYFDGDDENSNAQALDFARVVRELTEFPSKPAVIMPAHPVKNATRQNLTPKGGSSLVNEVDGNLTLWNEEGILTLHWQGKFRGAEFEPLKFELEKYQCDRLRDHKGRLMPTVLAKPILESRAIQIARATLSLEDMLLLNVEKYPAMSVADRCIEIGLINEKREPKKSSLVKLRDRLIKQNLIRRFRTNWELTKDGEKAVEIIRHGDGFAEDEL